MHKQCISLFLYCCQLLSLCDWKHHTHGTEARKRRPRSLWNLRHELKSQGWMLWVVLPLTSLRGVSCRSCSLGYGVKSDTQTRLQGSWRRKQGKYRVHESSSCFPRWVTISHQRRYLARSTREWSCIWLKSWWGSGRFQRGSWYSMWDFSCSYGGLPVHCWPTSCSVSPPICFISGHACGFKHIPTSSWRVCLEIADRKFKSIIEID